MTCTGDDAKSRKRLSLQQGGQKVLLVPSLMKGFRKQIPHMACALRKHQKFH